MGSHKELFVVYKDVICASSKFFKAACSERWVQGKESKFFLLEVEPKTFQSYVEWLYSGNYQLPACKGDPMDVVLSALDAAINLYLVGDFLDDVHLRNHIMEALFIHRLGYLPHVKMLKNLWARTTPASLLRKIFVEKIVVCGSRETFAMNISKYPAELVQEVALSSLTRLGTKDAATSSSKLESFLEPVPEDE